MINEIHREVAAAFPGAQAFDGLVPHRVCLEGTPMVQWGLPAHLPLDEDFHKPATAAEPTEWREAHSGLSALLLTPPADALKPCGFIFHVSHCGSTLISSMLAASDEVLSLCAPRILLDLHALRMRGIVQTSEFMDYATSTIRLLGSTYKSSQQRYVLKFNTAHLPLLPVLQPRFSGTPWLALYREPVEVMAGQFSRRDINPYWLLRDYYLDLPLEQRLGLSVAEGLARMLGRYYAIILESLRSLPNGLAVNYRDFSETTFGRALAHFDIRAAPADRAAMLAQARIYSKDPTRQQVFRPDSLKKRRQAFPIVCEYADRWARPHYKELEAYVAEHLPPL
jgi:hypothetical protein